MKLRDLLTRSIISFVDIFADRRKLPRIEMELILSDENKIAFSPAIMEVSEMILSVVTEVRYLIEKINFSCLLWFETHVQHITS